MPNGISLHIGVATVNEAHYGYLPHLTGAAYDATDMQAIAKKNKFKTQVLLSEKATRENVANAIQQAAATLVSGDIFLLTFSGHGGQFKRTLYVDKSENDGKDETWCLYDEQLIDDELYKLWTGFAAGVRVVVVSDSCHSGTITRNPGLNKTVPQNLEDRILKDHRDLYVQRKKDAQTNANMQASVLLIPACRDRQEAIDNGFNGIFTTALKQVLAGQVANYNDLIAGILQHPEMIRNRQTPIKFVLGPKQADFSTQKPFFI